MLSDAQISQFTEEGFVKIPEAFPRDLADRGPFHFVAGHRL